MADSEGRARRLGGGLVAAGLVLNEWVVARVATTDGAIDDPVLRGAIWAFDLAAIAGGVALLRARRLPRARSVALVAATAAISLLLVELALHAFLWLRAPSEAGGDPRAALSPYAGEPWAAELWAELGEERGVAGNFGYHPYLGWALEPYHGTWVQTDEHGVRRTWTPPDLPAGAPSLYVFGGSTVWGMGARDDHTLPSELARSLAQRGVPMAVHNRGQLAYTATQSLVQLLLLLRSGVRPDYVIFYDGVNDVFGAHQNGVAGEVLNILDMDAHLAPPPTALAQLRIAIQALLQEYSAIYRTLKKIPVLLDPPPRYRERGARLSDAELRRLAGEIVDYYADTLAVVDRLARVYGFSYVAFWQPVSFTETALREEERHDVRVGDEALGKLHRFALEALRRRDLPRVVDLSGALAGRDETYYVDYAHLSEHGNAAVARQMADRLLAAFPALGAASGRGDAGAPVEGHPEADGAQRPQPVEQ